ncbi:MAG TPA: LuxR C-terminal-related transcriptional regulator, partial [Burkholderiaceae bacterium]
MKPVASIWPFQESSRITATMTESLELYSLLLDQIYRAALEPEGWPLALQSLARWMNASKALLFTPMTVPAQGGFYYPHELTPQDMALWATRYQVKDFWLERLVERRLIHEGAVVLDSELHTEAELLESDWYREFLSSMDIGRLAYGTILDASTPGLRAVASSFFRSLDAPPFSAADGRRLGMVMPHLSRALAVMFRLRDAEHRVAASENALHALACGVLLIDASGQITFCNRAAQRLMTQDHGLSIEQGRLRLTDPLAQRDWQAALRASLAPQAQVRVAHFAEAITLTQPGSASTCLLQLSQLPGHSQFGLSVGAARVIAFITEGQGRSRVDPQLLASTWGLSRAEARTAVAMSEGGKLEDIAGRLGLSANTLKSQLKQVYQKTGCASRADLSRL